MRAVILLGLLVSTSFAAASSQAPSSDGIIHTRIDGIDIPSIPNAPFTAKVVVTWDQPLIGGGAVSRKYYTLVARDAQGRVHRETREFVPATSTADPPLQSFAVTDPVGGTHITCSQSSMSCTVADYRAPLTSPQLAGASAPVHTKNFSRESLGQQTIASLPVVGTRETTVTNTESRIVVSSRDLWYSPDLGIDLSVIRKDPQLGQISLNVTDLVRGEPDPTWFGVPPGYRIVDTRSNPSSAQ